MSVVNPKQASLHMAISLLHLNDVHEGILVGRSIAADIDQVIHPFGCLLLLLLFLLLVLTITDIARDPNHDQVPGDIMTPIVAARQARTFWKRTVVTSQQDSNILEEDAISSICMANQTKPNKATQKKRQEKNTTQDNAKRNQTKEGKHKKHRKNATKQQTKTK